MQNPQRIKSMVEDFERNISPIHIYLWIHGVGFSEAFQWKCVSLIKLITSIFFVIFFDVITLCGIIYAFNLGINRSKVFFSMLLITELSLRFMMYFKRRDMDDLFKRLAKVYYIVLPNKKLNLKRKLAIILIINDVIIGILIYALSVLNYTRVPFYLVSLVFSFNWGRISSVLSVYLCVICSICSHMFREFKVLCYKKPSEMNFLYQTYKEITDMVKIINRSYHNMILVLLVSSWWWLLYGMYHIVFSEIQSNTEEVFRILDFFLSIMRFGSVCLFASSMKNSALNIKETVYDLPIKVTDWECLRFVLKLKDSDVGFKLINSIYIDTNLIFLSIGNLLTYGILIATFSVNVIN